MTEPAPSAPRGWVRVLLGFALGALPVGVLATLTDGFEVMRSDEGKAAAVAGVAALWGFAGGLLQRSLLHALVGLNAGAALGFLLIQVALDTRDQWLAAALAIGFGAMLGALLAVRRECWRQTALRGACAGVVSFAVLALLAWVTSQLFRPSLLGWTVMSCVPFGGSLALFTWWVGRPNAGAT